MGVATEAAVIEVAVIEAEEVVDEAIEAETEAEEVIEGTKVAAAVVIVVEVVVEIKTLSPTWTRAYLPLFKRATMVSRLVRLKVMALRSTLIKARVFNLNNPLSSHQWHRQPIKYHSKLNLIPTTLLSILVRMGNPSPNHNNTRIIPLHISNNNTITSTTRPNNCHPKVTKHIKLSAIHSTQLSRCRLPHQTLLRAHISTQTFFDSKLSRKLPLVMATQASSLGTRAILISQSIYDLSPV